MIISMHFGRRQADSAPIDTVLVRSVAVAQVFVVATGGPNTAVVGDALTSLFLSCRFALYSHLIVSGGTVKMTQEGLA